VVAESERDRGNREAVDRLRQQPETVELLDDHVDGGRSVVGARSAGDDELPAAEQKRHHVGLVDPVDEPGELLRLVLDVFEPEPDRDRVEVEALTEICGSNDILDRDLGVIDRDLEPAELVEHDGEAFVDGVDGVGTRTHDLPGPEDQRGRFRVRGAVDEPGELLRVVVGAFEIHRDALEVELLPDPRGGNDVLYRDRLLRIGHYYLGTDLKHVKRWLVGTAILLRPAARLGGVYWLELAGEEDAFAAREAAVAATDVELLAPGVASAGSVGLARGEAVEADGTAIRRLAYTRAAHEAIARTEADLAAAAAALDAAPLDRSGTVAVRARNVRNTTDISTSAAERELGGVLVDRGFDVDLDDPDHVLRALFAAGERDDHEAVPGADGGDSAVCALGWVAVEAARDFAPKPTDRPFFQPGSMSPTDARAYANLAGAAPGRTLLDPMCGTGGLPLEAGIVGSDVIACDAQTKMVRGTRENLREYLNTALDDSGPDWHVARGDATALPLRDDAVDGVAFDAPYGRQSKIARHELADLVGGALAEAARVASRAVVVADRDWRREARAAGWAVDAAFERRVHRSLTRHVLVLDRE